MKSISILLLCAAQLAHAAETAQSLAFQPVAGTVIPMGGAVRSDNEAVRQRLVQLAGGSAARFVVIASASSRPEKTGADAVEQLRRRALR